MAAVLLASWTTRGDVDRLRVKVVLLPLGICTFWRPWGEGEIGIVLVFLPGPWIVLLLWAQVGIRT